MSLLPFRYVTFLLTVVLTVLSALMTRSVSPWWLILAVPCGLLSVLGVYEFIRSEIRQYFLEDDTQAASFSRTKRSIVYQRAKREIDKRLFGTQKDVYGDRYEWINHSLVPAHIADRDFRVSIGGQDCTQPYFHVDIQYFGYEFWRTIG